MKTLELKDICGYLSGRILGKHPEGDICWIDLAFVAKQGIELCNYRPVLHPMSDLTKGIIHRGEKFVPLLANPPLNGRSAVMPAKLVLSEISLPVMLSATAEAWKGHIGGSA